jgi:hypothetical protein
MFGDTAVRQMICHLFGFSALANPLPLDAWSIRFRAFSSAREVTPAVLWRRMGTVGKTK